MQCCLWLGCGLQIGGKHANFRPSRVAAGSDRPCSSAQQKNTHTRTHAQHTETHICKHTESKPLKEANTHQPELQPGEIIPAVEKYGSSSVTNMSLTNAFMHPVRQQHKNVTDMCVTKHIDDVHARNNMFQPRRHALRYYLHLTATYLMR